MGRELFEESGEIIGILIADPGRNFLDVEGRLIEEAAGPFNAEAYEVVHGRMPRMFQKQARKMGRRKTSD